MKKTKEFIHESHVIESVKNGVSIITAIVTTGYAKILCDDPLSQTVTVKEVSSVADFLKGVLGYLAGIVIGAFGMIWGIIKYLQSKAENNSAGESQAAWAVGVGLALIGTDQIINAIFG